MPGQEVTNNFFSAREILRSSNPEGYLLGHDQTEALLCERYGIINYPEMKALIIDGQIQVVRLFKTGEEVIFFDLEHVGFSKRNPGISGILLKLIPQVSTVGVEYFEPELRANARKFPLIGGLLEGSLNLLNNKIKFPYVYDRIAAYAQAAQFAAMSGKTVFTTDIADKAEFEFEKRIPLVLAVGIMLTERLRENSFLRIIATAAIAYFGYHRFQEFTSTGFNHPKKLTISDRVDLFSIDGVRDQVNGALLNKLSQLYDCSHGILVLCPKVHLIRQIDYLVNPSKFIQFLMHSKVEIAKRIFPKLDFALRIWEHDGKKWIRADYKKL